MSLGRNGWFASIALGLAACGGPSGGTDGGPDAGPTPDLPPLAAYEEIVHGPDDSEFSSVALDYACRGSRTRPTAGDPIPVTFQLRDFQDDFEVDDTEVWLFSNNEIGDSCDAPSCQSFTTDGTGNAEVTLPADAWYAYRVLPKTGLSRMTTVFSVFQYNEPAPAAAGGAVTGNSVSGSTIDLIPALLGISRSEGLAIVAGRIEDCSGNFVQNAILRMYDPDGALVATTAAGPFFHYFNGDANDNLPAQDETRSNADGLYVIVEVPVESDRPYRVEAWGNLDGEFRLLGCEAARIFPDAVTILNMTPVRGDAPAGCPAID